MVRNCILAVLMASFAVYLAGCQSGGTDRTATAASSIGDVRKEINTGVANLEATMAALNDLVNAPRADLKPQYDAYAKSLEKLQSSSKAVRERNQAMKAKTEQYLEEWRMEAGTIRSEQMRAAATQRRDTARESYTKMVAEVDKAKTSFSPLMDQLTDIQLYLSNDLTPAGVATVKPMTAEANKLATNVKDSLKIINTELTRVQNELSSGKPME